MKYNKLKYFVIQDGEVLAYILDNERFGLVVLFLTNKVDISQEILIHDAQTSQLVEDVDILDLILFPFPPKQVK